MRGISQGRLHNRSGQCRFSEKTTGMRLRFDVLLQVYRGPEAIDELSRFDLAQSISVRRRRTRFFSVWKETKVSEMNLYAYVGSKHLSTLHRETQDIFDVNLGAMHLRFFFYMRHNFITDMMNKKPRSTYTSIEKNTTLASPSEVNVSILPPMVCR